MLSLVLNWFRTKKEQEVRKEKVERLEGRLYKLRETFNSNLYRPPDTKPSRQVEDFESMKVEEIQKENKNAYRNQDDQLDRIIGLADSLGRQNQDIKEELVDQNKNLDQLNDKVGSTEKKMERTQGKLNNILTRTSNNCLYCVVLLEFIVLVTFIILVIL